MKSRTILASLATALLAVVLLHLGCAVQQPNQRAGTTKSEQEPYVETRVYDIRDLINRAPDFDNAPDSYLGSRIPQRAIPPQSLPAPGEELWVIAKPQSQQPASATDELLPGTGALMAKLPNRAEPMPVPLKHTDVKAHVAGYVATVDVTQQYHNPYDAKIEAVYVFPLPANAAVNDFLMTIGDRKIRGVIRERAEAEKIYAEAKQQGHVASLLTQERPSVFTQAVANIEPGKRIDVNIKFFHTLEYVDGWYEYVFPMVVGPRFNPPGHTAGIGAKAHGSAAGSTGQKINVIYLRPDQRSGHDVALAVDIDAGVAVERIECRSHKVDVTNPQKGVAQVKLRADDTIPNKDFVLRFKVAGESVKTALMTHRDERGGGSGAGGYFTLMIVPPASLNELPRQPLEMVFTLDVSGSMSGKPIEQSRAAIRYALAHMRPDDTFQIVRFSSAAERMSEIPLPATPENVRRALRFIESTEAGGGTMMLDGIRQSLNLISESGRLRFVALLTDGYIGNEAEILREVHQSRGNARVFSFGVGEATNRFLLDGMARAGAGAAAYLGLNDSAEQVMADFFNRVTHPALTDVAVDWGGMRVSDVYPQRMPDLFVGRPVVLTGRFSGELPSTIKVKGKVGGEVREIEIPIAAEDAQRPHNGIASVWARMKIADLAHQSMWQPDTNAAQHIKQVALEHGLMSAYTAFVAVDSSAQTAGDHGTTVAVPVPVPEGVKYETTVPEN